MSEIRFEFARAEHLPNILENSNRTYAAHCKMHPLVFGKTLISNPLEKAFHSSFQKNRFQKKAQADNLIVCLENGVVVGHVLFSIEDTQYTASKLQDKTATIDDISFSPLHQGRGLGKQALAFLGPIFDERGVTKINAVVWDGNIASQTLFEKQGYAQSLRLLSQRLKPPVKGKTINHKRKENIATISVVLIAFAVAGYLAYMGR